MGRVWVVWGSDRGLAARGLGGPLCLEAQGSGNKGTRPRGEWPRSPNSSRGKGAASAMSHTRPLCVDGPRASPLSRRLSCSLATSWVIALSGSEALTLWVKFCPP